MNIYYFQPLSRAWDRMVTALFRPFDLGKWLTVGFTAFLADLMSNNGSAGARWSPGNQLNHHDGDLEELFDFPRQALEWLQNHPGWLMFGMIALTILIAIIILLTWLSSRGKFMFLDNVVHNRSKVTQPWYEFKNLGNSLFLWRIGFGLILVGVIVIFVIQAFFIAKDVYERGFEPDFLGPIIGLGLLLILVAVVVGYILVFLNDFVIPIMYKNRISTNQAWQRFLALFSKHWWSFILYGLFWLLVHIAAILVVTMVSLVTCCIGLVLIIIPYIGSVILLPISYTFRGLGPEFLAQFGDEFDIVPQISESPILN